MLLYQLEGGTTELRILHTLASWEKSTVKCQFFQILKSTKIHNCHIQHFPRYANCMHTCTRWVSGIQPLPQATFNRLCNSSDAWKGKGRAKEYLPTYIRTYTHLHPMLSSWFTGNFEYKRFGSIELPSSVCKLPALETDWIQWDDSACWVAPDTLNWAVDCQQHTTTRCLLESWHIQKSTDNFNRERGTLPEMDIALPNWMIMWCTLHLTCQSVCTQSFQSRTEHEWSTHSRHSGFFKLHPSPTTPACLYMFTHGEIRL